MVALPDFTARGREPSAASGRRSEVSEWQRSKNSRLGVSPMNFSGTATGKLSFAVKKRAGGTF